MTVDMQQRFRLPGRDDPAPRVDYLVGVCAWAAALGLGGIAVVLRAFIALFGERPAWFVPLLVAVGLAGLLSTIGAFASIHRERTPWVLLAAGTVALLAGWLITGVV